jgi:hypothetical protein
MEEDWFVRRDGSMFPVSYELDSPPGAGTRLTARIPLQTMYCSLT